MKKKKGTMIGAVIAVLISTISLGIAFAAFSGTLNINGTATVEATKWDMYFTTAIDGDKPSSSGVEIPQANIQKTNLQNGVDSTATATGSMIATTLTWDAVFKTPGDRVMYTFYVKNGGSYNAEVTNVSLPTFTCTTKTGTDEEDAETDICAHIQYGIYTDTSGNNPVAQGQTIAKNTTQTYYLIAYLDTNFAQDGSDLPTETVKTSLIPATVSFGQAN